VDLLHLHLLQSVDLHLNPPATPVFREEDYQETQ
jgi:hypothetical protein